MKDTEIIKRMAQVGYERILMAQGMFVNKHPWDKEDKSLRDDWLETACAMLSEYHRLRDLPPAQT